MCLKVSARPVKACASFLSNRKVNKNRAMKIREAIKNKGAHYILALLSLFVLRFVNVGERRMEGKLCTPLRKMRKACRNIYTPSGILCLLCEEV